MCDMAEIENMLNEVIEDECVPYMLIAPARYHVEIQEAYPHIPVYIDRNEKDDVVCITAPYENFINGELVVH